MGIVHPARLSRHPGKPSKRGKNPFQDSFPAWVWYTGDKQTQKRRLAANPALAGPRLARKRKKGFLCS